MPSIPPSFPHPAYQVRHERIPIPGGADLLLRSLLDRQQYDDRFGIALALGISSAAWPLFGLLWPSGLQLAMQMAARAVRSGERILELGCGLGLASLVSHRLGADVTATDCHPLAGTFLRENVRLNALPPLPYRHGHWQTFARAANRSDDAQALSGRFDLVIASDVLYERDDAGMLASYIARHVEPGGEVWIVDPDRGNRPMFNRHMVRHGFTAREDRLDTAGTATSAAYRGRLMSYRASRSERPG